MKKILAIIISVMLVTGSGKFVYAEDTSNEDSTYTIDTHVICNAAAIEPAGIYTYSSKQPVTYTMENRYGGDDVVGFEVDGKLVEPTSQHGITMTYTFPAGTVGNHVLHTGLARLHPEGYYVQLKNFTWEYRKDSIAVGASYQTKDSHPQFKWEVFDLAKLEWKTIQDWSDSNWVDWKGKPGDYWLHCSMRSEDKMATTSQTICFHYVAGNSQITGTYAGWDADQILLGATAGDSDASLQFKIYDLDTKQWTYLTDSKNKSNWIKWTPKKGNYWMHYESYTSDGRLADTKTYCFAVK